MKACEPQLQLVFKRRGGARRGSGRKRQAARPQVPHTKRPELSRHHPVHVTLRLCANITSIRKKPRFLAVRRALAAGHQAEGFRLVHYSVQTNHLHLLIEAADKTTLARNLKGLQVRIARALNKLSNRQGRVFADRYHVHILRTPLETRHAIAYVLLNARKHAGRTEQTNSVDPCSSARHFNGWNMQIVCADLEPEISVAPAQTWLLRDGWRRHGLISPSERMRNPCGSPRPPNNRRPL